MNRKQAMQMIAKKEFENLSYEERELILYNSWGIGETDALFEMLNENLQKELLNFDEPQYDVKDSRYDDLIFNDLCHSYCLYSNEKLAKLVSQDVFQEVKVYGDEPVFIACPCCGNRTLIERGEYEICSICSWEDDGSDKEERYSSPNHMTLKEAKKNYLKYGSMYRHES